MAINLDEIAVFATAPANAWYLSGAIITLAMTTFVSFRLRITPLLTEMENALAIIEAIPDAEALVNQIAELDANLSGKLLGPPWREFRSTLVLPEPGELARLLATRDPIKTFAAGRLITGQINLRFYQALPNMLVGIGILGTFIGLLFGIHVASKGLAAPDIAVARGALHGLLSAAALKFSTSVAGLLSSLLFSWREKQWLHRFETLVAQFVTALEMRIVLVTSEGIALSSMRLYARQESLLVKLPERLSTNLATQLTAQIAAITANYEKREQLLIERFERVTRDVTRVSTASVNADNSRLTETLDRLIIALESYTAGIREHPAVAIEQQAPSTIRETNAPAKIAADELLTPMIGRLTVALEEMTSRFAASQNNVSRELNRGVDAVGGHINHALSGMENAIGNFTRFGSEAERLLTGLRDAQVGFATAAAPVAEAASSFKNSATRMEGITERIQDISEALRNTVSTLSQLELQVFSQWREYGERFANLDAALANTFNELDNGLSRNINAVHQWVEGVDHHTTSIIRELSAAISELRETVGELTEILLEGKKIES